MGRHALLHLDDAILLSDGVFKVRSLESRHLDLGAILIAAVKNHPDFIVDVDQAGGRVDALTDLKVGIAVIQNDLGW